MQASLARGGAVYVAHITMVGVTVLEFGASTRRRHRRFGANPWSMGLLRSMSDTTLLRVLALGTPYHLGMRCDDDAVFVIPPREHIKGMNDMLPGTRPVLLLRPLVFKLTGNGPSQDASDGCSGDILGTASSMQVNTEDTPSPLVPGQVVRINPQGKIHDV